MICMSNKYIKGVASFLNESKNAINQSDKKTFDIVLNKFDIKYKKKRNGSLTPGAVQIDAFCSNPEFSALGKQKVSIVEPIVKSQHQDTHNLRLDYQKTIKKALDKIQKYLKNEKEAFSPVAVELEKYANNFPIFTFLSKIFAKSVRI